MLRPLGNRVLVKKIERSAKTAGGIIIPETASDQEQGWQAEVRAVGPGKRLDNGQVVELTMKRGDRVIIGRFRGSEVKMDGEALFVVEGDDVLGVVEE